MGIKTGIGIGDAQIYDTSSIEKGYYNLLKNEELKQAKFQEEMAGYLAKYSNKGLKPEDIKLQDEAYAKLKQVAAAGYSGNATKRNEARFAVLNGMKDIDDYNQMATQAYKTLDEVSADALKNPWAYQEGTKEKIAELYTKPYANWGDYASINKSTFERMPDITTVDKVLEKANKLIETSAKREGKMVTNKDGRYFYQLDPAKANSFVVSELALNPEARYTLIKQYKAANPDKEATTEDLAKYAVDLYSAKYSNNAYNFYGGMKEPKTGGATKEQQAVYDRGKLLDKLVNAVPGSDKELLEVSSLPYGTDTQFLNVTKGGKLVKQLFKITVPKSGWESAAASNPLLAEYGFGTDDASGKKKVFEFDLSSPDARRGLNVFIDQFSGGKNVQYKDVKPATTRATTTTQPKQTQPKASASNIPSATRKEWIAAGWNNSQIDEAVKLGKIKVK